MSAVAFYVGAGALLVVSLWADKNKTRMALKKATKSLGNIMPMFLSTILIMSVVLAVFSPQFISSAIGSRSGWMGMLIASITGSITMMPGFIAFPLAAALLKVGAGLLQITVFVSNLMMVGVVTIPLEREYLGTKLTFLRNGLAFVFSFLVAFGLWRMIG